MPDTLKSRKAEISRDLRARINRGEEIAGSILPKNPFTIQVVGKSFSNLQARIIYSDQAPYYITVTEGDTFAVDGSGRTEPAVKTEPAVRPDFSVDISEAKFSNRNGLDLTFYPHGPSHGFTISDMTTAELAVVHRYIGEFLEGQKNG
jgi:hypothetical protein